MAGAPATRHATGLWDSRPAPGTEGESDREPATHVEGEADEQPGRRGSTGRLHRTGLRDGDIVAIHRTPEAQSGQVVVARFGDEVTLKRFVRIDERHVELRPESHNPAHRIMKLDLAKHILQIEGVAVGAVIGELRDAREEETQAKRNPSPAHAGPRLRRGHYGGGDRSWNRSCVNAGSALAS